MLTVSRTAYYDWSLKIPSARERRQIELPLLTFEGNDGLRLNLASNLNKLVGPLPLRGCCSGCLADLAGRDGSLYPSEDLLPGSAAHDWGRPAIRPLYPTSRFY